MTDIKPTPGGYGVTSTTVHGVGEPRTFYYHNTGLGGAVVQAVLSGSSYPIIRFITNVHTIVDVGANVGAAALYFAAQYPEARVLAFEPFPPSYQLLVRNLAAFPNVTAMNIGLLDQNKQVPLYLGLADPVTNSIAHGADVSREAYVTVTLREAKAVLAEHGIEQIDILKLDTEGSELPILRSISSLMPKVSVLYIEFHHEADRLEIDQLLKSTHMLVMGKFATPHRGELCYVLRELIPPSVNASAITL